MFPSFLIAADDTNVILEGILGGCSCDSIDRNSRIIRIGLLNEKVNILWNRLIPHFENVKTGKL